MEKVNEMSTTSERREALRDRLLAAAEATIAAEGVAALRARTLAEQVGCAVGAIYTVFPDLDALILACNGRTLEAIDAAMHEAVDGATSPAEQLETLGLAYLAFAAHNPTRWRALFEHRMPAGSALPDWYAVLLERVFRSLRDPIVRLMPGADPDRREMIAQALFAAVHGIVILGLDGKVGVVPVSAIEARIRFLVRAALAGEANG